MPSANRTLSAALGLALLALAGCSKQPGDGDRKAAPTAAADTAAAQDLDTYRQLVRIHNDEMATTMGENIVQKYPGSAAAREVQQTLPAISKRYHENAEKNRLAGLWLYQVSPMLIHSTPSFASTRETSEKIAVRLSMNSWGVRSRPISRSSSL